MVVQPILSRFSVPPTSEKEERVNPDIKRLNPAPSYEKNRKVGEMRGTSLPGQDFPD